MSKYSHDCTSTTLRTACKTRDKNKVCLPITHGKNILVVGKEKYPQLRQSCGYKHEN